VLTRLTTWSAIIFMITSLSLTVLYMRGQHSRSVLSGTPTSAPASAPAKPGK
jgi:preprotein translocase subunit SecG